MPTLITDLLSTSVIFLLLNIVNYKNLKGNRWHKYGDG